MEMTLEHDKKLHILGNKKITTRNIIEIYHHRIVRRLDDKQQRRRHRTLLHNRDMIIANYIEGAFIIDSGAKKSEKPDTVRRDVDISESMSTVSEVSKTLN